MHRRYLSDQLSGQLWTNGGAGMGCQSEVNWDLTHIQLRQGGGDLSASAKIISTEKGGTMIKCMAGEVEDAVVSLLEMENCVDHSLPDCVWWSRDFSPQGVRVPTSSPPLESRPHQRSLNIPPQFLNIEIQPLEGYHPIVKIHLNLPLPVNAQGDQDLSVLLLLDQNAFADPFQLDGLNKNSDNITFYPFGEPDLEASVSSLGARLNGVLVRVGGAVLSSDCLLESLHLVRKQKLSFEIPFHMRYQAPRPDFGYTNVTILFPALFLTQSAINPQSFLKTVLNAHFHRRAADNVLQLNPATKLVSLSIPRGITSDVEWVRAGTAIVACLVSFLVVTASWSAKVEV
ncbi:hypothetical protein HDU67_003336 [Dinochytrium kinnereticum]|nr:hypothetical protein HDU67_003336 [Dinochytrium kinnereticum]